MFSNPTSLDLYNLELQRQKLQSQNVVGAVKEFPKRKPSNKRPPPLLRALPFAVDVIRAGRKTRWQKQRRRLDLLNNSLAMTGRLMAKNGHYCVNETHIPEMAKQYMR